MAIKKFITFKVIITKGFNKKNLSITAWLLAVFTPVLAFTTAVTGVEREAVQMTHTEEGASALIWSITILYFCIFHCVSWNAQTFKQTN